MNTLHKSLSATAALAVIGLTAFSSGCAGPSTKDASVSSQEPKFARFAEQQGEARRCYLQPPKYINWRCETTTAASTTSEEADFARFEEQKGEMRHCYLQPPKHVSWRCDTR